MSTRRRLAVRRLPQAIPPRSGTASHRLSTKGQLVRSAEQRLPSGRDCDPGVIYGASTTSETMKLLVPGAGMAVDVRSGATEHRELHFAGAALSRFLTFMSRRRLKPVGDMARVKGTHAPVWWQVLLGLATGLLLAWLAGVAALYVIDRRQGNPATVSDALRLLPVQEPRRAAATEA